MTEKLTPNAEKLQAALALVEKWDFTLTKRKLLEPDYAGWSQQRADNAEKNYKRYLSLVCALDGYRPVPSADIDRFWHEHILDTERYAKDCDELIGSFLHHYPYFGMRGEEDDALAHGRSFRTFNLIDDYNREALRIEVDVSMTAARVLRVLEQVASIRGLPEQLRVDHGPEFTSAAFVHWCESRDINFAFTQPGLRRANLRHSDACFEDIDYRHVRGLNKTAFAALSSCEWVRERHADARPSRRASCRSRSGMTASATRPLPTLSSTDWSTTPTHSS